MRMDKTKFMIHGAQQAFIAAALILVLAIFAFFTFEPSVGRALTDSFTVTQTISNEISFSTAATDVSMVGTITGLTGGISYGTTTVVVNTNNATGYNMSLHFSTTTSGEAMQASSTAYINDYTPAGGDVTSGGTPDHEWVDNASGQAAEFGYAVYASSTTDVTAAFLTNGSACGSGTNTSNRCWANPTTSPKSIINTVSPTPGSGSTTTIQFKIAAPNPPSPLLPSGTYLATGTLTAVTN